VQFEASWCGPCHQLAATFKRVAPSYQDTQVRLPPVDADEFTELQSYLQGGYPTVRTFVNGTLASASFLGSKSDSYVRKFIDKVIEGQEFEFLTDARMGAYCPVR